MLKQCQVMIRLKDFAPYTPDPVSEVDLRVDIPTTMKISAYGHAWHVLLILTDTLDGPLAVKTQTLCQCVQTSRIK